MKRFGMAITVMMLVAGLGYAQALDTESWPPDTDFSQEIHFWSADDFLTDAIPAGKGGDFLPTLTILSGGDQTNEDVEIGGVFAKRATSNYFNVRDEGYWVWPDVPVIDVLVQYFASAESIKNDVGFLLGVLGNLHGIGGFTFESLTDKFEWRLFRIDNSGGWAGNDMVVSPIPTGGEYGGVNGGTIRFERVSNVIFRAVAFGPEGAFGEPEVINATHTVEFNPDLYPNVAEWDMDKGVTNGLNIYRDPGSDQEIVESENIGPANDKRKAARPAMDDGTGGARDIYVNWEILNEHFGPTSQPSTRVKLVAEYYDDPALAGTVFGPEVYVTAGDALAFYPGDKRTTLAGSGKWKEAVWYVKDVKFKGVN
ncbi:MAG: hypothetical protein RBU29_02690, partial [bacterium]|nr:hypothetical protein [bacterium]